MKRASALMLGALAACSAAPAGLGAVDQGADAASAIDVAKVCVQRSGEGMNDGFAVLVEQAEAHRDPSDGSRWIVVFPPGQYMGRLPPPRPGSPLLLAVAPTKGSECTKVPAPTPAH